MLYIGKFLWNSLPSYINNESVTPRSWLRASQPQQIYISLNSTNYNTQYLNQITENELLTIVCFQEFSSSYLLLHNKFLQSLVIYINKNLTVFVTFVGQEFWQVSAGWFFCYTWHPWKLLHDIQSKMGSSGCQFCFTHTSDALMGRVTRGCQPKCLQNWGFTFKVSKSDQKAIQEKNPKTFWTMVVLLKWHSTSKKCNIFMSKFNMLLEIAIS